MPKEITLKNLLLKIQKILKYSGKMLKKLINLEGTTKPCPQKTVSSNGDILMEPSDIANESNSQFSKIVPKLAKTISSVDGGLRFQHSCSSSFYLYETSENEVMFLIENLSEGKAQQHHDIPTKFIKLSKLVSSYFYTFIFTHLFLLAPIITHLFNRCINEGSYPDCFKIAQITPVYKSADQRTCNNYRPISILLQFNKIVEKILHTRVYAYLQEFNLLSNYQYYFKPKSATAFAVENIYSNLLINRENGLYTCSIFLDLSKAFDTVNHDILLQKLQFYFGIRGIPLQLFSNYLLNRKKYVINRNTSLKNLV